jgi:hypothetical protein
LETRSTADLWIIEAFDLDVALNLATEGSEAAIGRSRCGATLRKPPAAPTAGAGVQRSLRRVGSFSTGVPEVLKESGSGCRIGAEVFVAEVSGRPQGRPNHRR